MYDINYYYRFDCV